MEVGGQLHALTALSLGKDLCFHLMRGCVNLAPVFLMWGREKSLYPGGNRTQAVHPINIRYTDPQNKNSVM
jgi:hypothetical protein